MPHSPPESPLTDAIRRILAPLVRLMIARGVRFQDVSDWLKEAYLSAATRHFAPEGRRLTDSRLSVLTGLQRRDIKALRARIEEGETPAPGAGPLPRLIAHWRTLPEFRGDGGPAVLARSEFERLAATVSTDIHPRTLLDEMLRLDLAVVTDDGIRLTADAYVPGRDDAAMIGYLGANLGDHAEVAVANVLATGPARFERAVHYNRLSPTALAELDAMARRLQQEALEALNARAMELQDTEGTDPEATGRFRFGAYVLTETNDATEAGP